MVENEVKFIIKEALKRQSPAVFVTDGIGNSHPAKFPCVDVALMDSKEDPSSDDETEREILTFDVNIYTNNKIGARKAATELYRLVNKALRAHNFRRIAAFPVPILSLTGNTGSASSRMVNIDYYRYMTRYTVVYDGVFFYRREN